VVDIELNLHKAEHVMSPAPSKPQSAAERRAAEAQVKAVIEKFAPEHLALVSALRKSLRNRLPTAHEHVYEYTDWVVISYSPNEHGYAGVLAIRASADGVKLYFNNGKGLPDPGKLLKGSAKLVRYIPVEAPSTLARPAVVALIDAAIARNKVPFAATGDGPVVLRLKSGK
jgi:hypothetical protein